MTNTKMLEAAYTLVKTLDEEVCDDCEQHEMDEYTGCAGYKRFQDEWN